MTRTYGEESKEELISNFRGLDESDVNVRLPYILNNLPPYTGPPSHSVVRNSLDPLTSIVEHNYLLKSSSSPKSTTTTTTLAPYIDPTTPTNVTVTKGKTAMLVCVVTDLGTAKVSLNINCLFLLPFKSFDKCSDNVYYRTTILKISFNVIYGRIAYIF